jgi:hypothetical protein
MSPTTIPGRRVLEMMRFGMRGALPHVVIARCFGRGMIYRLVKRAIMYIFFLLFGFTDLSLLVRN